MPTRALAAVPSASDVSVASPCAAPARATSQNTFAARENLLRDRPTDTREAVAA